MKFEADFHPNVDKVTHTMVWICLEQLTIEYYHPDFLKHVGNKLGKLLKLDAVTSSAMRGRFARLCVQINMTNPLPKRVKIGSFWQDIVYENIPVLCYHCERGRVGNKEVNCLEAREGATDTLATIAAPRGDGGIVKHDHSHIPWKAVHTCRPQPCGPSKDTLPRPMMSPRQPHPPNTQCVQAPSFNFQVLQNKGDDSVTPAGFNCGENCELQMPHAKSVACMQSPHTDSCTRPPQVNPRTSAPACETTPISSSVFTEQKESTLKVQYGTLVRPTVHDPHPDRSRSSLHPNSHRRTESPTPSLHAHVIPSSQRPSSSDGERRTDLESPILNKIPMRKM